VMRGRQACIDCLRRAWLLAALAPHIERSSARSSGRRTAELLALDDDRLLAAVAPRHGQEMRAKTDSIDETAIRRDLAATDSWAVCRHSDYFPAGLRDLGDAPAALFGRGDPDLLGRLQVDRTVTVVGARRSTSYGLSVARELGRDLARSGLSVVSGLALGIDGAVQTGAVEAGLSCAVLGCGVDIVYPPRHRSLYGRHIEHGLVLSELPIGTAAWRWAFPARNRLMAAMTIVVEAAERSGSLITATMAQELGRDLGAVPGPITSAASVGPNGLLGQGACVIRSAQDVLDAMLGAGQTVAKPRGPDLEPELRAALECFEYSGGSWEEIEAVLAGRGISAMSALGKLEALGYLRCSAIGAWSRTTLLAPT